MSNLTFLEENQIFGDNQLEIFKKYGTKCAITDFSALLGGFVSSVYTEEGSSGKDRTGWWWTKTDDGDNDARVVTLNGISYFDDVNLRSLGARPALPYSSISSIASNKVRGASGVLEVEYGEYPQWVVDENYSKRLESAFGSGTLKSTGKQYTTDSVDRSSYSTSFSPRTHVEYEYNGKKYIRFIADSSSKDRELSDGRSVVFGQAYWVEVSPVKWLVDEAKNVAITKQLIFSGVQFNKERNYKGDFSKTDIKRFMDDYLYKDLTSSIVLTNSNMVNQNIDQNATLTPKKSRLQKINPDTTAPNERRKMTDTEIIHNWIESGQSVLLRGPSGIGKTERLKTLYPDLIYIKLTNNMFPEKVVGSMNLQTGQSIPPDFAKQAILSCADEEEKKLIEENIQNLYTIADNIYEKSKDSSNKVVILLDELLNVKPAVQSLVYTLVLNKLVETGKGLKLPANTVVVATGNQKKYSNVAEDLAEPLEKRFDHILDMEPKVGEWINGYAIPNKVHPSVIGYILSKYMSNGRSENIPDMGYFYEEPDVGLTHLDKNGCNGRTNDPRGWVSISNTLYAFEKDLESGKFIGKDVESLLKVSIGTKLRDEWATEFFDFYNLPTLSVEEVVEGNYTQADFPRDINERFAYVTALLLADESQVGSCREFIRKHCDPEYLTLYDICWIGDDESRMEKISELQELTTSNDEMAMVSGGIRR